MLKNTGNVDLYLNRYYLSDDENDILKRQLPRVVLKPGETVTVYGKKYDQEKCPDKYRLSFSWKDGEPVILSHHKKGIVDQIQNPVY